MDNMLQLTIVPCLMAIAAAKSGDYFEYYNQSDFSMEGTSPRCTVYASYSTGYPLCRRESSEWESQQEFDLQYWELVNVCGALDYLPDSVKPDIPWGKKNNVPKELLWPSNCACPRFECEGNATLNNLYNKAQEDSQTFKEITTLTFSDKPIEKTCHVCQCRSFLDSYGWDCSYYLAVDTDTLTTQSWRSSLNPIDNPEEYPSRDCSKVPLPTLEPTKVPLILDQTHDPTPQPTPVPSAGTTAPTEQPTPRTCTSTFYQYTPGDPALTISYPNTYFVGQYFWETADGCNNIKLCYCQDDNDIVCETGYSDIMNNDMFYYEFVERCGDYISECWQTSEADRLFKWYDYTTGNGFYCDRDRNDYLCPRCGCTTDATAITSNKVNTTFDTSTYRARVNETWTNYKNEFQFNCANCSCVVDRSPRDELVAYVPNWECKVPFDSDNNYNYAADCYKEELTCYGNYGPYEANAGQDSCNQQRYNLGQYEDFCSFEQQDISRSSPDGICIEDDEEWDPAARWECEQAYICESLGGAGCYRADYDYQVTAYDCLNDEWVVDTYKGRLRKMCCGGTGGESDFNCNNNTIEFYEDMDCDSSNVLADLQLFDTECENSQMNIYDVTNDKNFIRAAFCGDSLNYADYLDDDGNEDTESLCEMLQVYWQSETFCDCNSYRNKRDIYTEAGVTDLAIILTTEKQSFLQAHNDEANNLKAMYEYWGCSEFYEDTFFSCDFDADRDNVNNRDAARNIFSSSSWLNIFAVISIGLIYNKHTNLLFLAAIILSMTQIWMTNAYVGNVNWGRTGGGSWGDCEFSGSVSSGANEQVCEVQTVTEYQYQEETVSWEVLNDACPNLRRAGCYTEDNQLDQDELIWPTFDNRCSSCPRCPCNNATDTVRHYVDTTYDVSNLDDLIVNECYRCTCEYWPSAEVWAWDCIDTGKETKDIWAANDTFFCTDPTEAPTMAPTYELEIKCMEGDDFDSLTTNTYPKTGSGGASHCQWFNATVERYDDGEPHVCVFDETGIDTGYEASSNSAPFCQAIAGDNTGCYYADFDYTVQAYDCLLDEWVTDTYTMQATLFCCNDGDYCNNQTMVMATIEDDPFVEYVDFSNETVQADCRRSDKLKGFLQQQLKCPHSDIGLDDEYVRATKCRGGATKERPTCDTLDDVWKEQTECVCQTFQWLQSNVNETYDEYIDEVMTFFMELVYEDVREQLTEWNRSLECNYAAYTRWNDEGILACNGGDRPFNLSIIAAIIAIVAFVSY